MGMEIFFELGPNVGAFGYQAVSTARDCSTSMQWTPFLERGVLLDDQWWYSRDRPACVFVNQVYPIAGFGFLMKLEWTNCKSGAV